MKSPELLRRCGESIAKHAKDVELEITAAQLREIRLDFGTAFADAFQGAPCAHRKEARGAQGICFDCGRTKEQIDAEKNA